jgi:hypothetical protein
MFKWICRGAEDDVLIRYNNHGPLMSFEPNRETTYKIYGVNVRTRIKVSSNLMDGIWVIMHMRGDGVLHTVGAKQMSAPLACPRAQRKVIPRLESPYDCFINSIRSRAWGSINNKIRDYYGD